MTHKIIIELDESHHKGHLTCNISGFKFLKSEIKEMIIKKLKECEIN